MCRRIIKCNLLGIAMFSLALMACSSNALATSSLSVSLSPTIDLELVPSDTSTTSQETTNLTISTNNTEGFRVLVNSTDTTSLINAHHSETIPTVTSPTTLTNLPTNTWGLYLGATSPTNSSTFSPISLTPTELVHNELANASGTYKLAIGAKVDTSLPAGMYSNELVVSVVADPAKLFSGITYMQDMTPDICATADEHETTQLIDKRDGKSYWVAKLKDGNCWMTQNLALDITEEGLRAEDTNIKEDWNASSTYPPKETISTISTEEYDTLGTYSWNFGKYVMAMPLQTSNCSTPNIASCTAVDFIDVSKDGWEPGFKAQDGNYNNKTDYVAVDETTKTYDEHYLIGNYYQHNTAAAGHDSNGDRITQSICPKNWQLPPITYGDWQVRGTIYYMMEQYGLGFKFTSGEYNAAKSPTYFVKSGYVNANLAHFVNLGSVGYLWLGGNYNNYGYNLIVSPNNTTSTQGINHWVGEPIRCLVITPTS